MCDVAARCPACGTDLAAYETYCGVVPYNANGPHHRFECQCGAVVTVTEPVPGLVQTRQDAVFKP